MHKTENGSNGNNNNIANVNNNDKVMSTTVNNNNNNTMMSNSSTSIGENERMNMKTRSNHFECFLPASYGLLMFLVQKKKRSTEKRRSLRSRS